MKKYRLISFLLALFLSLSTFSYSDDIYNNSRAMKVKSDNVGGIAIPGVKIVVGEDNIDGGYLETINGSVLVIDTGFLHNIMAGNIPGHTYAKIEGHSHSVGTTEQELSALGTADFGNWPAAAAGVVLVSTDVDDDGDPTDTGARTVTIYGLEDNAGVWTEATTVITMNGTTPTAASVQEFIRINRMAVTSVGTSLTNEGDITASISGTNIVKMYAEHSSSKDGRLTIGSNEEGHFQNIEGSNVGNKEMTYHIYCRDNTVANSPFLLRDSWHSKDGGFRPNGLLDIFNEKVDIIFQGHAELAGAKVSSSVQGYIKTVP